jgi:hypothetical protein
VQRSPILSRLCYPKTRGNTVSSSRATFHSENKKSSRYNRDCRPQIMDAHVLQLHGRFFFFFVFLSRAVGGGGGRGPLGENGGRRGTRVPSVFFSMISSRLYCIFYQGFDRTLLARDATAMHPLHIHLYHHCVAILIY